ncbi:MAG: hypothetical protein M3430_19375 [Acidobacteriota bacterium]|nr:hypothetical protein [Acidobacteriota bacterium]
MIKERTDGETNTTLIARSYAHKRRGGLGDNSGPRARGGVRTLKAGGDKLFD